jgi:hypothetical protein
VQLQFVYDRSLPLAGNSLEQTLTDMFSYPSAMGLE